ncbi:MAG: DNA-protecting protein DprA [Acidobacteria bacterium]|nr:DNA-protecting protein DprA [Acidobacteriota bacterium]
MRPEAHELLVAALAGRDTPAQVEAFLRLQMAHLRRGPGGEGSESIPVPRLDLPPEGRRRAEERLERTLERAAALGAFLWTPWDPEYPSRLRTITGPPPVLFVQGDRTLALDRSVAVVGTRTPSRWGAAAAGETATRLAAAGWTVVSGLGVGIDRHAHAGALAAGGRTVAVLPGGLDRLEPPSHVPLAEAILRAGGLLLSEIAFGTPPTPASRIARDRIQSGIALATVVVETEVGGGTMHTARFALEQDRPLFVLVPPDATAFQSGGSLQLLYRDRTARPVQFPDGLAGLDRGLREILDGVGMGGRGTVRGSRRP